MFWINIFASLSQAKEKLFKLSSYLLVAFLFFLFFFSLTERMIHFCKGSMKNVQICEKTPHSNFFDAVLNGLKKIIFHMVSTSKTEARIIFLTVATYFLKLATINKCLIFISMVWWWSYYFLNIPTLFSNFSENTVLSGKLSLAYFLPLISFYNP